MKLKNWRDWTRQRYVVAHSRDGFLLAVDREHVFYSAAERATSMFLTALGDPCCGEGPLAKFDIKYGTLRRFGIRISAFEDPDGEDPWYEYDPNEGVMDVFWFRVLNLPNKLHRLNKRVASIPLTDEQARTIRPSVDTWFTKGPLDDEDDRDYGDCCMTAETLGSGWHSYGCENFQGDSLSQLRE